MSNKDKFNLHLRVTELELQVERIKNGMSEIDNIISPTGWIGKAFEQLDNDLEELREEMNQKFAETNKKLDIIIKHLTGLNDNEN